MKRVFAGLLALVMCLSLCACGGKVDLPPVPTAETVVVPAETASPAETETPAPVEAPAAVEEAAPAEEAPAEEVEPDEPEIVQVTVDGRNGPIALEITVEDGVVTDVEVLEHSETVGVGAVAVEWLPGRIVEAGSADVDGVSGATITSDAIKAAVSEALAA